jgi:hypothetical protein
MSNTIMEFTVTGTTPSLACRKLITTNIYAARAFLRELRADGYLAECRSGAEWNVSRKLERMGLIKRGQTTYRRFITQEGKDELQ